MFPSSGANNTHVVTEHLESSNKTERGTNEKISTYNASKGLKIQNTELTTGGIEMSELRKSLWDTE